MQVSVFPAAPLVTVCIPVARGDPAAVEVERAENEVGPDVVELAEVEEVPVVEDEDLLAVDEVADVLGSTLVDRPVLPELSAEELQAAEKASGRASSARVFFMR